MKIIRIAILLFLLATRGQAWGGFDEGFTAYERGDYDMALRELGPLAEYADYEAQYYIGTLYYHGKGVPQDYEEAVKWYRRAANQGYAIAQFNLAILYNVGQGVSQDHKEAVKWYRKAADLGHASAQNNLGVMYANGLGVAQDYVQAYMWFDILTAYGAGEAIRNRDAIAEAMTPAQITEAQKLAREWIENHQ